MSPISPILAGELTALPDIAHAFFTRSGGVSKGIYSGLNAGLGSCDSRKNVVENRKRITRYFNIANDRLASPIRFILPMSSQPKSAGWKTVQRQTVS